MTGQRSQIEVRPAVAADRAAIVEVLAVAFADDPVFRWNATDRKAAARIFLTMLRFEHNNGNTDVATQAGRIVGAALWDPPGWRPSLASRLIVQPWWVWAQGRRWRRGVQLDAAFHRARPDRPAWYLGVLGAAPQGSGVGTTLLQTRINGLDQPAYLEATSEPNIAFYERFGFKVVGEIQLPRGPRVWPMLRP